MLRSINSLLGYHVQATDGDIGTIYDFFFDGRSWEIRYLVADTGHWLPGRKVLISPEAVGKPDWKQQVFPVELTKNQISESPDIDAHKPVSRQQEIELFRHYGWSPYWPVEQPMAIPPYVPPAGQPRPEESERQQPTEKTEPDLRSAREVVGYHIHATDGQIGRADELIVDGDDWLIRYMVVDTAHWLSGRKVLVSPEWTKKISWAQKEIYVDLSRDRIEKSPPYDPSVPVNREYEVQLYDYYGRPAYWL